MALSDTISSLGAAIINLVNNKVKNSTITIKQGGSIKGSFTLNQSGNAEINLDTGGANVSYDATTQTLIIG